MPTTHVESHPTETQDRFAVGWQKLTREEFLEALAAALVEKVQNHQPAIESSVLQSAEQAP